MYHFGRILPFVLRDKFLDPFRFRFGDIREGSEHHLNRKPEHPQNSILSRRDGPYMPEGLLQSVTDRVLGVDQRAVEVR